MKTINLVLVLIVFTLNYAQAQQKKIKQYLKTMTL